MTELMVVKKKRDSDSISIKIVDKQVNRWVPSKYEKIIPNKDSIHLAELFYELSKMGYNIDKAFAKYKSFLNEPSLFFT
jgi:hypothetical protein